ncbi:MAG: Hpt domain-containing protein [Nostoc sp. DedSLP01]|nr:Hpt domain-containing protein [Nostoc sp. DedSLP01]
MSNYTIFELFRQEVETNVATLKQCLSRLQNQPFSMNEIEQAIQAAHSLWGITSILEMEAAANLLHLMKDCFMAVQKQNISLREEEIDTLLHASDLLLNMSKAAEDQLDTWMTNHAWDWNTTQKTIANLAIKEQVIGDREKEREQEAESNEESLSPLHPAPVASPPLAEVSHINGDGSSMMDLFKLEAEVQVNILNNGLLAIENKPQSAQELEALMRAAHSIKGAARIVGLDGVVELAHVMEDCFVSAQSKTITLTPDDVDVLLQGVDLLQSISQLNDVELPGWLGQHQADFTNIRDDVAAILQPGGRKQKAQTDFDADADILDRSPIPNPQSPISNPQSPVPSHYSWGRKYYKKSRSCGAGKCG